MKKFNILVVLTIAILIWILSLGVFAANINNYETDKGCSYESQEIAGNEGVYLGFKSSARKAGSGANRSVSHPDVPAPKTTFAPNSSATFIIKCVDAEDANNVLYTQMLKEVIIGERTIKAPTVNNYNLITDSPKNIKVLYPETTVIFEYEYVPYETPVPTFEPVSTIEPSSTPDALIPIPTPTMEIFISSLSNLTINCVERENENNILYSQTIPSIYYNSIQEVAAPPVKGYIFSGEKEIVTIHLAEGSNTVTFVYDRIESEIKDPNNKWELIINKNNVQGDIVCAAENITDEKQNGVMIIGYYDKNGILLDADIVEIEANPSENINYNVKIPDEIRPNIKEIRAFVWDNLKEMKSAADMEMIDL